MDYSNARKNMVEGQLMPNKINDAKVLAAFSEIPREAFVHVSLKNTAYVDDVLSSGYGRTLMKPMVCARLIQAMDIQPNEKVLICASGSGYTAAVVSKLGGNVYAVEADANLCEMSRRSLGDAKCRSVKMERGDHMQGLAGEAPFDKLVFNMPVSEIPKKILDQLNPNATIGYLKSSGTTNTMCDVVVATKSGKTLNETVLMQTVAEFPNNPNQKSDSFVF